MSARSTVLSHDLLREMARVIGAQAPRDLRSPKDLMDWAVRRASTDSGPLSLGHPLRRETLVGAIALVALSRATPTPRRGRIRAGSIAGRSPTVIADVVADSDENLPRAAPIHTTGATSLPG